MEFLVNRVSLWDDEVPPCDGAYKELVPVLDRRTSKSFKDFEVRNGESFLKFGTNHRVTEGGGIIRDLPPVLKWKIKITSLKQLTEFTKTYGDIILKDSSITIYDDYIE